MDLPLLLVRLLFLDGREDIVHFDILGIVLAHARPLHFFEFLIHGQYELANTDKWIEHEMDEVPERPPADAEA